MMMVQSGVRRSSLVALSTATDSDDSVNEGEAEQQEDEEEGLIVMHTIFFALHNNNPHSNFPAIYIYIYIKEIN